MLKQYRKGFVRAYLASIGIVLAIVFTAVGVSMHRNDYSTLKDTMQHILVQYEPKRAPNDGDIPTMRPDKKPGGEQMPKDEEGEDAASAPQPDLPPDKETVTRPITVDTDGFLVVAVDKETDALSFMSDEPEDLDSRTVESAVHEILASQEKYGTLKGYSLIYYKENMPDRIDVAMTSVSYMVHKDAAHGLLLIALFVVSMGVFWIISNRLSNLAAKPMEKAMQMERQFVTDISHDLKTPITVILANNNVMRGDPDVTVAEQMQWIDSTDAAAKNMMDMVQQMLTLSALESVTQSVQAVPVDLSSTAEKCVLQLESLAYDRMITMHIDIAPRLWGMATAEYAERICSGLLENALKYEPDHGSVRLTLRREKSKIILTVRNCGSEIAQEDLPHIFERFYRGDKSRNIRDGHGLGLPILHQVTDLIQAQMDVESSKTEGTAFTVRFRAAENQ